MRPQLLKLDDKILLKKRSSIEIVNDQLKNQSERRTTHGVEHVRYLCPLEHTRHRSSVNFMINLVAALVAYTHQPQKPSFNFSDFDLQLLSGLSA